MSAVTPPGRQATLDEGFAADARGAERDESGPAVPDAPQDPDCHHDAVWYESGTCMVCEPKSGATLDRDIKRELTKDSMGGIL